MGLFDKIFGKKIEEQIEDNQTADIFKFDLADLDAVAEADSDLQADELVSVATETPVEEDQQPPITVVSEPFVDAAIDMPIEPVVIPIEALPESVPESTPEVTTPLVETPQEIEDKYEKSLKKTSKSFGARFNAFLSNFRSVDEAFFEELEDTLIMSDVGVDVATQLTDDLRHEVKLQNAKSKDDVKRVIIEKMVDNFGESGLETRLIIREPLTVMLFVGVNGVGKTTTIGKLANRFKNEGKQVLLAAADTFRAGATDQLVEWSRRSGVDIVVGKEKSDPASVVFDAVKRAQAEQFDVLLIDTAGRLQNKDNLMKELEKMGKIIKRELPDAPHETLLALDATTGQNAISQAKEFSKVTPLTGIVLTKLDGSAKGGIILTIQQILKIPVKLVGLGEGLTDLENFDEALFVKGLFQDLL
ncbi:MAG: signal recognition particle-docking protein FtsY [Lactococcus sp.]|uniref:Signal recognition particle receptor FtsY n=1 Tax=Pseudolactococcus piscium MKFS47 TaxID=297352 RepID=A0A0D6DYF2_9LACT|nr:MULTISPECIES: signal recognition particle-docking protein FtsY [Lactococcus]MDN5410358.1 signal recognition particle-docking protein FtsY [Lactococcus sp.]MDN5465970.1 signal recognition particle-docking protein FtsY [Lactococcus sp.]MDN6013384.1 signal recognition particle-docking protein FtsY [Lactococcus sp.]MDN6105794.1 signal recognition particle-docking protein FtsY [Lactococcus sp.]MDN6107287.1 signal recognition particle-docking protein FtsY [Lactococcus sp.]